MNGRSSRRGYAMMLVLVFIALVFSFYSLSHRYLAAALRVETVRTLTKQRDEGSVHALAAGLARLETGLPPSDPYICAVSIDTSTGLRSFVVTFTSEEEGVWAVEARPKDPFEDVPQMPESFTP